MNKILDKIEHKASLYQIPKFDTEALLKNVLTPSKALSFGYKVFDEVFEGLKESFTYLLAAKSANAKSLLALNILHNLARKGVPCTFFDLENGSILGQRRLLQIYTGWSKEILDGFREGKHDKQVLQDMANKVSALTLVTYYSDNKIFQVGITLDAVVGAIRRTVELNHSKVVVVDNLRNLKVTMPNENMFLSQALTKFDSLANELKISIILVHHISIKDSEKPIDTDNFEQETSKITIPHISRSLGTSDLVNKIKAAFTIALDPHKKQLYVWVQKNRDGETDRRFKLNINLSNGCITDPPNWREAVVHEQEPTATDIFGK